MAALEGREYGIIVYSSIALILLTALTYQAGMAIEPYEPRETGTADKLAEQSWWETGDEDDQWWTFGSDTLESVMNLVVGIMEFVVGITEFINQLLYAWDTLISVAGWASVFFVIPMFVSFAVLVSAVATLISEVLPTT